MHENIGSLGINFNLINEKPDEFTLNFIAPTIDNSFETLSQLFDYTSIYLME